MGLILIGQTNEKIISKRLQRALRTNMTDAEQALWKVLRGRQFLGHKFRRQHRLVTTSLILFVYQTSWSLR